jgi:hypothetical protein
VPLVPQPLQTAQAEVIQNLTVLSLLAAVAAAKAAMAVQVVRVLLADPVVVVVLVLREARLVLGQPDKEMTAALALTQVEAAAVVVLAA